MSILSVNYLRDSQADLSGTGQGEFMNEEICMYNIDVTILSCLFSFLVRHLILKQNYRDTQTYLYKRIKLGVWNIKLTAFY